MKIEEVIIYKVRGLTYNRKEDAESSVRYQSKRLQKGIATERKVLKNQAAMLKELESLKTYEEVKAYFKRHFISQYLALSRNFSEAVEEMGINLPKSDLMFFLELLKRGCKYDMKHHENKIKVYKAELRDY